MAAVMNLAPPRYSLIAPLYNEEENVEPLLAALTAALDPLGDPYEIILVDDGSADRTAEHLLAATGRHPALVAVIFEENRGQTVALQAGFDHAKGERIITIDGDLEKDPAYIKEMAHKLDEEKLDIVYFQKEYQADVPFRRRIASRIANRFRHAVIGDQAVDVGSTFIIFRENYLKERNLGSGMHRFFLGLMEAEGKKIGHVNGPVYNRKRGVTKYTSWGRLKQGLSDLFYFYLYKNRRAPLPGLVMTMSLVAALLFLAPVPSVVKGIMAAAMTLLFGALITLAIHAIHLVIQREKKPYRIREIRTGRPRE